ncbi:MAG: arylesterase, partial [Sphingopyxis sp.]
APQGDARLILAFGDSLYAGYGVTQDQGFAPQLEQALNRAGHGVRVHNAGVSGDTTAAGLARLAFTLDGLPKKPDLAIVGLGGNDMLRGINPEQTRANLDAILTQLDQRGIPAMLTGMLAPPNMGAQYASAFNPIYPALARKHGAALYPFFLDGVVGRADLIQADHIHPTAPGIAIIVGKIAPAVAAALPPVPGR